MFINFFFLNLSVYDVVWKNKVERGRPQMTVHNDECLQHDGYLRLQTRALRICNNYLFLHDDNAYANAPYCCVYMYIACLVWFSSSIEASDGKDMTTNSRVVNE